MNERTNKTKRNAPMRSYLANQCGSGRGVFVDRDDSATGRCDINELGGEKRVKVVLMTRQGGLVQSSVRTHRALI